MRKIFNQVGAWTVKHHWLFLLGIFGFQWLTGEATAEPEDWHWLMDRSLALKLHRANGRLVLLTLIYMAVNRVWLWLKRRGKI